MRRSFFPLSFLYLLLLPFVYAQTQTSVTPYTHECRRFRLRVDQKADGHRTVGYVAFSGVNAVVGSTDSAFEFAIGQTAGNYGLLFSGNRRVLGTPLGSQVQHGYGPLQRYAESAHKLGYHRSWTIGPQDYLHLTNKNIDFPNDRARFCYSSSKQLIARLSDNQSAKPKFACTPVSFYAQCVDAPPPNPSDDATPELMAREFDLGSMDDAPAAPEPISWLTKRQDYWRS